MDSLKSWTWNKEKRRIAGAGVRKMEIAMFSLHQMGSCRMGRSITDSVADGEGECWEVAGLYVADASAFPTASGAVHGGRWPGSSFYSRLGFRVLIFRA